MYDEDRERKCCGEALSDFSFTTMQLNKDYNSKMHVDANNQGCDA